MEKDLKTNQRVIGPYRKHEMEVIREDLPDGTVVYKHPADADSEEQLQVYQSSLDEIISQPLEKFKALALELDDDFFAAYGYIAESIIESYEQQFSELCRAIEQEIGDIEFDLLHRGQ